MLLILTLQTIQHWIRLLQDSTISPETRVNYHKRNCATDAEVAAAKKRQFQIDMEHAATGAIGLPAWANGLQTDVGGLTREVGGLTQAVAALTQAVGDLTQAVGGLTRDVAALTQTVDTMAEQLNDPQDGLKAISHRLKEQDVRNINRSSVRTNSDPIQVIPHPDGGEPRWIPRTQTDISTCTARNADVYLNFYNIQSGGTLAEKRLKIQQHLGIII